LRSIHQDEVRRVAGPLLVVLCLAGSACGRPAAPPPKALTDDEFIQKLGAEADQKTSPEATPAASAFDVCTQFVRDRLKAPASAKFAAPADAAVTVTADDKVRVLAYVDSQNSFGALIRNNYDCAVHRVRDTHWGLDHLDLTSR